jgi:hypothetical protein
MLNPVARAVNVSPFTLVAVATPRLGVVRDGLVAKTIVEPDPVVVLPNKVTVPLWLGNVYVLVEVVAANNNSL